MGLILSIALASTVYSRGRCWRREKTKPEVAAQEIVRPAVLGNDETAMLRGMQDPPASAAGSGETHEVSERTPAVQRQPSWHSLAARRQMSIDSYLATVQSVSD